MASAHKPRSQSPRPGDVRTERNPASSGYNQHMHNRQTSIVNGLPHRSGLHSRSGSYVNSPATSPLSPMPIMQATISPNDVVHIPQYPNTAKPPMSNIAAVAAQTTQIQLPQMPVSPVSTIAMPVIGGGPGAAERPGLYKGRSAPNVIPGQKPQQWRHHPSGSFSHHHTKSREEESKTPAEYALHILFTQVRYTECFD